MLRPILLLVSIALVAGGLWPARLAEGGPFAREIQARSRIFPEVGPGVSALKRGPSGRYYILSAPATSVAIYSTDGHRIGQIPSAQSGATRIAYASDLDLDTEGRVFVADRGSNAVLIFGADGSLLETVPVATAMSIVALSGLEFAATLLHSDRLVSVFNAQAKLVRAFGDPPRDRAGHPLLSPGRIYGDETGQIYFVFTDLPDPTVRRYDRFGFASYEISLPASEFRPAPEARPWTTVRIGNQAPPSAAVIGALAVDGETQEVWVAVGNELIDFDKDGSRRGAYLLSTKQGQPVEARSLVVEHDRILIADDPNRARRDRPHTKSTEPVETPLVENLSSGARSSSWELHHIRSGAHL